MPVLKTAEAQEVCVIKDKQLKRAYRSFSLVEGIPAPAKESPLLKVLTAAGIDTKKVGRGCFRTHKQHDGQRLGVRIGVTGRYHNR